VRGSTPGNAFLVECRTFQFAPPLFSPSAGAGGDPDAMNLIAKLLPPANILLGLDAGSKKRVFEQAGLMFENNQGVGRSSVFDSLFAREKLGSTGLGQGIAIPHGRVKGMKDAIAGFIRLANPVQFDAPDGKPVSMMVVLLVPEHATEVHLQILSELAQMFSDRELREALASIDDPAELHRRITTWQAHATGEQRAVV
jgi:PTS system nitrogen regulatory IIA component